MSIWIYLEDPTATYSNQLFERNITNNLYKMALYLGVAGIYYPQDHNINTAKDLLPLCKNALIKLKKYPDNYKQYNASNGWGTIIHMEELLVELIEVIEMYRDANYVVS